MPLAPNIADPNNILSMFQGGAMPASADAGGASGAGAGMGAAAGAGGSVGAAIGQGFGAFLQLLEARQQAKLSRRITRGLRRESIPFLRELTGLTDVAGKGGVVGGSASPEILAAQKMLASPRVYSDTEIQGMQAAKRLMNPRFRSLSGAATGSTLMKGLPVPSNMWESVVQPRMEAMAYNQAAQRRAIAAANQWRNQRFVLGSKGFVK
jgi:hypothetical protein